MVANTLLVSRAMPRRAIPRMRHSYCPKTSKVLGVQSPKTKYVPRQLVSLRIKCVLGVRCPRTKCVLGARYPRTECVLGARCPRTECVLGSRCPRTGYVLGPTRHPRTECVPGTRCPRTGALLGQLVSPRRCRRCLGRLEL